MNQIEHSAQSSSVGHSTTTLSSTSTAKSAEERDRTDNAYTIDNYETLGWRIVLLLQFQALFEAVIMIGIYISYICTFLDLTFVYSTHVKNLPQAYYATGIGFIYCFDVIYMVDILSMISYKNTEWIEMKHSHDERHTIMLIFDIISIIPWDAVYYSLTLASMRAIYILRLRYILRIFRFIARIYRLKNTVGHDHVLIEFLVFLINVSLLLVTVGCIFFLIECQTSCKITSRGYPVEEPKTIVVFFLFVITNYFCFLYISGFKIGLFLIAIIQKLKQQYIFKNVKHMIITKTNKTGVKDQVLTSTSRLFFELYWKNRKGFNFDNANVKIIPEVMAREISLDIAWDALKHTHLFRNQEVHFLRYVASCMKQKFMVPGDTIYRRNHFKSCMVYLVTGVIQILSEEDGETPILSFSGGTCIGESTLLVDYPSTCSVICQSYCEVYILYRKDYLKMPDMYPKEYQVMLQSIQKRYKQTREFKDLLENTYKEKQRKIEVLTIKWLKTTLHELMLKEGYTVSIQKTLTLEERRTIKEIDKLLFCADYLDLLVITEQIELVTDTVFLQTTCPCILQPDSFIVTTWNKIIAVAALIFAFAFPYYACFESQMSDGYFILSYIISLLWGLDIYINLSTAIKTKDGIITDNGKILLNRIRTFAFCIDLLAAVPLELLTVLVVGHVSSQMFVLLQACRLLKLYTLGSIFGDRLSESWSVTRVHLKYGIYALLLIYYIAALIHLQLCFNFKCQDKNNVFVNFVNHVSKGHSHDFLLMWIYFALQQITNFTLTVKGNGNIDSLYISIIFVEFITTIFYVYCLADISATEALNSRDKLKLREYITSIKRVSINLNLNPELYQQIISHIRGQLMHNKGADLCYTQADLTENLHPTFVREYRKRAFSQYMKNVPLFSSMSDDAIANLAAAFYVHILVPGDVVAYSGEICKEMHILINGYCEMIGAHDEEVKVLKKGTSISATELCLEIPIINTVVAVTHCIMFTIKREVFLRALQRHPEITKEIKAVVADISNSTNVETFSGRTNLNFQRHKYVKNDKSFKNFGYKLHMDTKEGVDFHSCFDKLGFFGFLRYLFMRHTIRANGSFMFYWEIFRCIFAFATAILAPLALLNACNDCVLSYFLYFCDAMAWLDIYVRHHVCYFDERGVEITHPLKTAIHYWRHGLLVDVLGVLPFETIVISIAQKKIRNRGKTLLKMIRLLQVHRIINGIRYLNKEFISASKIWTIIKFLPIVILAITTLASLSITKHCSFAPDIKATKDFAAGVSCKPDTWIARSIVAKPITPLRAQLYGIFAVTVLSMGPALGGASVQNMFDVTLACIFNMLGFWCFIIICSKIIAENLFRNADLTSYQEAMRNLVKFLAYRRIDVKLRNEVIDHFEYIWRNQKSTNLHKMLKHFDFALQEDILLDTYGKALKESEIFLDASDAFFKSLLLNMKHEMVMKRGIISKVHDIQHTIYFIFKGQVEALGPDYNRLLILPVGSLFGNIDNCIRSRQTLTMVAKGHVELLTIDTLCFHGILSNYHNLKTYYRRLTAINTDYILGAPSPPIVVESSNLDKSQFTITSAKSVYKITNIMDSVKRLCTIYVWEKIIIVLVCYIGSMLELYQITVQEHSKNVICILYFLDFLSAIHIYIKLRTAFEDEFGVLVTNKKEIAMHYIKAPVGFPLHLASIIPFELLSLAFVNWKISWTVWSYCRCNRCIRIFFVIYHFHKRNQQLNINVYVMRTLLLFVWTSLILQLSTSLMIVSSCFTPEFNVSPLIKCSWANMTSIQKFETYTDQFAIVLYIFTMTSSDNYFPNSPFSIILMTCLLIGGKFLTAIVLAETSATLDIVLNSRLSYDDYIEKLKEHMVRERTSAALLDRVWLYVRLLWRKKDGLQFPTLLLEAPYYLREGVLNSMFGFHLRRHSIFRSCHVDLIRQISARMRTRTFFPGDYITFINDIDGCMYFIHEGSVDALSEEDMYCEKIDMTLNEGEMFGFRQGLYLRCGHEYTYKVNRYTVVVYLKRSDWIYLLDFFPASRRLLFSTNKDSVL